MLPLAVRAPSFGTMAAHQKTRGQAEARTREQLDRLVSRIRRLSKAEQHLIREAFGRRMKEVAHAG